MARQWTATTTQLLAALGSSSASLRLRRHQELEGREPMRRRILIYQSPHISVPTWRLGPQSFDRGWEGLWNWLLGGGLCPCIILWQPSIIPPIGRSEERRV